MVIGLEPPLTADLFSCWIWDGPTTYNGYGLTQLNGKRRLVHRVAYEQFVGPIPAGLEIDHVCHTNDPGCRGGPCLHRRCWRPDHLEAVTHLENVRRGSVARRTHCPRGHPYTPENTYVGRDGSRKCRTCDRDRQRLVKGYTGLLPPAERVECPAGHPYDEGNTYIDKRGQRHCRTCHRESQGRYREQHRERQRRYRERRRAATGGV